MAGYEESLHICMVEINNAINQIRPIRKKANRLIIQDSITLRLKNRLFTPWVKVKYNYLDPNTLIIDPEWKNNFFNLNGPICIPYSELEKRRKKEEFFRHMKF